MWISLFWRSISILDFWFIITCNQRTNHMYFPPTTYTKHRCQRLFPNIFYCSQRLSNHIQIVCRSQTSSTISKQCLLFPNPIYYFQTLSTTSKHCPLFPSNVYQPQMYCMPIPNTIPKYCLLFSNIIHQLHMYLKPIPNTVY